MLTHNGIDPAQVEWYAEKESGKTLQRPTSPQVVGCYLVFLLPIGLSRRPRRTGTLSGLEESVEAVLVLPEVP